MSWTWLSHLRGSGLTPGRSTKTLSATRLLLRSGMDSTYSLSFYSFNGVFCIEEGFNFDVLFALTAKNSFPKRPGHKSFLLHLFYFLSYCSFHSTLVVCMGKMNFCCSIVWYLSQTIYLFEAIVLGDFDTPVIILYLHWMSILLKEKKFRQHIGCTKSSLCF